MNTHEWPCRIKSARRKRRLVKTDRDKQLIQLDKRRRVLWQQRVELPWLELEQPYQRGWKRFFVLRDDVRYNAKATFYETLLAKINTVEYHHDKSFKRKKRRKQRYHYQVKQQVLREFELYQWDANRVKLTDEEKTCFTRIETFNVKTYRLDVKYVVTEPWRYVLKVVPNMITHIRIKDRDIETELGWIDNRIDNYYLSPRMDLLTRGRGYHYNGWRDERDKYHNKIKNIPRYSPKEAYLELET